MVTLTQDETAVVGHAIVDDGGAAAAVVHVALEWPVQLVIRRQCQGPRSPAAESATCESRRMQAADRMASSTPVRYSGYGSSTIPTLPTSLTADPRYWHNRFQSDGPEHGDEGLGSDVRMAQLRMMKTMRTPVTLNRDSIAIARFDTSDRYGSVCASHSTREVLPTVNLEAALGTASELPASPSASTVTSTSQSNSRQLSFTITTGGKKRFPGTWNGQKGDAFEFDADKRLGRRWYCHARDPRRIGPSVIAKHADQLARGEIGPFCGRLIRREGLPYVSSGTRYNKPGVERAALPCSETRSGGEAFEPVINVELPSVSPTAPEHHTLAVCASQDSARVDRIMVNDFVTAIQARCKRCTNVLSKVSGRTIRSARFKGAQLEFGQDCRAKSDDRYMCESVFVLYKGAPSRLEGVRPRKLLKSLSVKQGIKYDSPGSARDILAFIQSTNSTLPLCTLGKRLNTEASNLLPARCALTTTWTLLLQGFQEMKPDSRPVEIPDDPNRLVSGADCQMVAFEAISEATRSWINGCEFTIARSLGNVYKDQVGRYAGGFSSSSALHRRKRQVRARAKVVR
ncbi:hypothetical protein EDB85DRAFT_2184965 [Lactarius pseudohatsudake]|nr:hypothetical protein EDB85DRAFT_2184965 [Lactarius pseudohatsudake]